MKRGLTSARHSLNGYTRVELVFLAIIVILMLAVISPPFFSKPREKARSSSPCINNQRQITLSMNMWAAEHQGKYPKALGWAETIQFQSKLLDCDKQKKNDFRGNSYAYNVAISGKKSDEISNPVEVVMTTDCLNIITDNILRSPADLDPRHGGKVISSFADGHVELMKVPEKLTMPKFFSPEKAKKEQK